MEQPNVIGNESDFYDEADYIEIRGNNPPTDGATNNPYYDNNN